MEQQSHFEIPTMTHSKMNHDKVYHERNPSMDIEEHNYHVMMIADFKKWFCAELVRTVPIMLLSALIHQLLC